MAQRRTHRTHKVALSVNSDDQPLTEKEKKERRIKQLAMVVCICKGIPLKHVLPAIESSETVAEVNRKTGCGSGGCKGERCGPRIKKLLSMKNKIKAGDKIEFDRTENEDDQD